MVAMFVFLIKKDLPVQLRQNMVNFALCDDTWNSGRPMDRAIEAIQTGCAAYQCSEFAGSRRRLLLVKHPKALYLLGLVANNAILPVMQTRSGQRSGLKRRKFRLAPTERAISDA